MERLILKIENNEISFPTVNLADVDEQEQKNLYIITTFVATLNMVSSYDTFVLQHTNKCYLIQEKDRVLFKEGNKEEDREITEEERNSNKYCYFYENERYFNFFDIEKYNNEEIKSFTNIVKSQGLPESIKDQIQREYGKTGSYPISYLDFKEAQESYLKKGSELKELIETEDIIKSKEYLEKLKELVENMNRYYDDFRGEPKRSDVLVSHMRKSLEKYRISNDAFLVVLNEKEEKFLREVEECIDLIDQKLNSLDGIKEKIADEDVLIEPEQINKEIQSVSDNINSRIDVFADYNPLIAKQKREELGEKKLEIKVLLENLESKKDLQTKLNESLKGYCTNILDVLQRVINIMNFYESITLESINSELVLPEAVNAINNSIKIANNFLKENKIDKKIFDISMPYQMNTNIKNLIVVYEKYLGKHFAFIEKSIKALNEDGDLEIKTKDLKQIIDLDKQTQSELSKEVGEIIGDIDIEKKGSLSNRYKELEKKYNELEELIPEDLSLWILILLILIAIHIAKKYYM